MEFNRIFVTGDTHGNFDRIEDFYQMNETDINDLMVVLGDAGINYYLDYRDRDLKEKLSEFCLTIFCIHGNHEARPWETGNYDEVMWNGGIVYIEPDYPNIIFAKDGEIYDFNGKKAIVIGGAYSIDKYYRIRNNLEWFDTEQPDEETMAYVESQLEKVNWKIDYVFSHTVPISAEPTWAFIPGVDQSRVDKSTEEWLEKIHKKLDFEKWFAGHYHVESEECGIRIMYEDFEELE